VNCKWESGLLKYCLMFHYQLSDVTMQVALTAEFVGSAMKNNRQREGSNMGFEIGESVTVKSGVTDPDFGFDISGWQGRVIEVDDSDTVFIRWDSLTLNQMGLDLAIRCDEENLDWEVITLSVQEVEKASARDTKIDVDRVASSIQVKMIELGK